MSLNIHISSTPPHLKITETMIFDFLIDPVLGVKVLFGEDLDVFQRVRLKICWWTPRVIDSSGLSSAKTTNMWWVCNLRALLMPNHRCGVYYPSFDAGKRIFTPIFLRVASQSAIYRAQVGRQRILGIDGKSHEEEKALKKGPACYVFDYKNGSQVLMPAPGFLQDAKTQAGQRFHDLYIDEWTKIMAMGEDSKGIDDQLIGRTTMESWNKNHPIWRNHHLFLATAEDTMHPAHHRYASFMRNVRAGDPDYSCISFNFKDYSDKPTKTGASFKERFREDLAMRDMKANKTASGFLQEGLGIWSKNGKGWYTSEMIDRCFSIGATQGAQVYCSRGEDPEGDKALYFLGIDPARAETKKADDGALVVLRAVPLNGIVNDIHGYKLSFCYAYKVRGADAPQWSAIIHKKHQHFHFTGMLMDPLGGGSWIQPELKKVEQFINGVKVHVRPIATLEDEEGMMVMADFILAIFRPKDIRVAQTWGSMGMLKMENLIDIAHTELREAFLTSGIGFPPFVGHLPKDQTAGWSIEKRYGSVLISDRRAGMAAQLQGIFVQTNEDGTTFLSKPANARLFNSRGKKDFAYAGLYAYARFKMWLTGSQNEIGDLPEEDAAMCWGAADN
jgi:hypothetical protein